MGCNHSKSHRMDHGDNLGLLEAQSEHQYRMSGMSASNGMGGSSSHQQQPGMKAHNHNQNHGNKNNNNKGPPSASHNNNNSANKALPPLQANSKPVNRAHDRVDAIPESLDLELNGIKIRYAYLSQRGQYPDDPFKANQDAYSIHEGIARGKADALFCVFDGHGKDGDACALYAKEHLHQHLKHILDKTKRAAKLPELTREHIQECLTKTHIETNKGLHKTSSIDDSLSGTTAISVYFHGRRNRITISNVGDSRAVLGQEDHGHGGDGTGQRAEAARTALRALPLSRDQTPYRKDERNRIRATGARIMSLDQLEGLEPIADGVSESSEVELGEELDEGGDPPRVWHPTADYPGTAFTRSIGDALAEELGVFAEPEMLTREITPEDKMIVIASDGVFEFLTNQSVIDICAKFNDPLEACRAVVAEAYELWLQYELRTDDITIICIFIEDVKIDHSRRTSLDTMSPSSDSFMPKIKKQQSVAAVGAAASAMSSAGAMESDDDEELTNAIVPMEGIRPVRSKVSKEKSKAIEKLKTLHGTEHMSNEGEDDWRKYISEKTEEEEQGIAEAIKASIMFRNINQEQREMVFACMESVKVKAGTWVIRQGTVGERFYIIDEGRFEVRIVPDGEQDVTGEGGHIVHVYEGSRERHAHPAFGELALMYSAPRSASIVAQTDGHLWALHRSAFRQILIQSQDHRKELKKVLGEIPYFQYLDADGINKLAAIMDETTFGRGESIIHQGKPGETLYVIQHGSCYSVRILTEGTRRENLKAGAFFGDEILSGSETYDKTVVTLQTTTCWQMNCALLKQTMGPLLRGGA